MWYIESLPKRQYSCIQSLCQWWNGMKTIGISPYVDGILLTYGPVGSRQHIWTFATAYSENWGEASWNCACTDTRRNWLFLHLLAIIISVKPELQILVGGLFLRVIPEKDVVSTVRAVNSIILPGFKPHFHRSHLKIFSYGFAIMEILTTQIQS